MKIKLPKDMVGTKYDRLFTIEINNFNPDMLLPALFFLVRSNGRERGPQNTVAKVTVAERSAALAGHNKIRGLQGEDEQLLLDKWVRSSLIQTNRTGRGRTGSEAITFVRPLCFLSYKPAPAIVSRLRQAHYFLYHLFRDFLARQNRAGSSERSFERCILQAFGRGVALTKDKELNGTYDGSEPLDLETLLQLYYMDGFAAPRESNRERPPLHSPACYQAANLIARDFLAFLEIYADKMPASVLARHLVCLLNFELLIYTLRLFKATTGLVLRNEKPPEFKKESVTFTPLDLYVDLTQERGSRSDQLAYACVNRDFENIEGYFRASLTLRTLDRYIAGNPDLQRQFKGKEGGEYITALNELGNHPDVSADARRERSVLSRLYTGETDEIPPADIAAILESEELGTLAQVIEILVLAQRRNGINNLINWFGDVGGLDRTDGILRGNTKGKRVWRYVMGDMLLETLVQLAVISPDARYLSGNGIGKGTVRPDSITLSAFLKFLRDRFGLLIDAPPAFDESVEATAAAKDNFASLKTRLRQMGLFLDLSDDFNTQRIFPRFCEPQNESPVS